MAELAAARSSAPARFSRRSGGRMARADCVFPCLGPEQDKGALEHPCGRFARPDQPQRTIALLVWRFDHVLHPGSSSTEA
jgi:hypothetical protein